jgi:hypothetical protein
VVSVPPEAWIMQRILITLLFRMFIA